MTEPIITAVFVYGTLKRGQCRESRWPVPPHAIHAAWTQGCLFDRSDYPAMTPGTQRVRGEVWQFTAEQMERVLEVLDEIEVVPELYVRAAVEVFDGDNQPLGTAWTYHYATDPTTDGFKKIEATGFDPVQWP